jgi:hypothetical protein
VLRHNGIAIVATNGEGHMRQFRDLFARRRAHGRPGCGDRRAGVSWEVMIDVARAITDQIIARDGVFTTDSHSGLIVCRGPRRHS